MLLRDREQVWGGGLADAAALLADPERLAVTAHDHLTPAGLIDSTAALPGWTVIHGSDRQLRNLANAIGDDDHYREHVLEFGYDFRRSITEAAGDLDRAVRTALQRWPEPARRQRVIVVAHSMGGLVARHWLGPGAGWPLCLALITLGTPHRGAPKALDWLANGVQLGPRAIDWMARRAVGKRLERASRTLAGWPSLYELLPRYPAVVDPTTGVLAYPHELRVKGFDHEQAAVAFAVHKHIERAWDSVPSPAEGGPHVVALVGHGHPTPERCELRDGHISVTKDQADYLWDDDWQGDGTVPGRPGWPIELDRTKVAPHFVPSRHGELPASGEVTRLLRYYSSDSRVPIEGVVVPDRPVIGLELEELYESGPGVPIAAQVRNARPGPGAKLQCTLRRAGSPRPLWRRALERDGDRWSTVATALAPDFYEVTLAAVGFVPEPPPARDRFGVVEL